MNLLVLYTLHHARSPTSRAPLVLAAESDVRVPQLRQLVHEAHLALRGDAGVTRQLEQLRMVA
jgi:hypothetical protein